MILEEGRGEGEIETLNWEGTCDLADLQVCSQFMYAWKIQAHVVAITIDILITVPRLSRVLGGHPTRIP